LENAVILLLTIVEAMVNFRISLESLGTFSKHKRLAMKRIIPALFLLGIIFISCRKVFVNSGYLTTGPSLDSITFSRPDHTVIVVEENHGYDQIVGSASAPFINQLIKRGALFTNSHGIGHPSQPNYLALFSGNIQGVKNDNCLKGRTPFTTPNLAASLLQNGFTFKGFAETMPSIGYADCQYKISALTNSYLYARKHAPWVNWSGVGKNNFPDSLSLPMSQFPDDYNKLPSLSFVIPDMDNDMHNSGKPGTAASIKRADDWLKNKLGDYISWAQQHNSLFILTFDEDDFTKRNHILTLFTGPMVKPGNYPEKINHYNLYNTIQAIYELSTTGQNSTVIRDVWN
jgi:acid phosphatase